MRLLWFGVAGGVLSLGAVFSTRHLFFDLISHFRVQYIVLLFAFICFKKRFVIGGVLAMCFCVHAYAVFESQAVKITAASGVSEGLRVMSSNLLASNANASAHIRYIESIDPDLIVFQEYTNDWDVALSQGLRDYKHKVTAPIDSPFGIAIYSKIPLFQSGVVNLPTTSTPSVKAIVALGDKRITVLGVHPPPPISNYLYDERNRFLQKVADLSAQLGGDMIVVGDLNVTPWSQHFRDFLDEAGLKDGRVKQGVLATWPAAFFPLQIPIDHILAGSNVNVVSLHTSSGLTSDHRTLWGDIEF